MQDWNQRKSFMQLLRCNQKSWPANFPPYRAITTSTPPHAQGQTQDHKSHSVLWCWGLEICIPNICCWKIHIIQGRMNKSNFDVLFWYYSIIIGSLRVWSLVTILYPSSLLREVHLHVKYEVSSWLLVPNGFKLPIFQDLEGYWHIAHFLAITSCQRTRLHSSSQVPLHVSRKLGSQYHTCGSSFVSLSWPQQQSCPSSWGCKELNMQTLAHQQYIL